ncbi:MAG: peptidylprolyl isomerase [Nevskia sp.]|nr:peptidylprolyl isomerase [Nevskia sp.]
MQRSTEPMREPVVMKSARACLPLLGLLLLTAAGDPPPSVPADVVAQRGDVTITTTQLGDLLATLDPAQRAQLQANPTAMADFVRQRVIGETLLSEARAKGWDKRPEVVQKADEARDAVIVQTYAASLVPSDDGYPSDTELSAAYEANKGRMMVPRQYHLAQIVFLVPPGAPAGTDDAMKSKAQELRTQAVKPKADFADLARKNSQETASAPKGGDVGWLREDQILPVVREVVTRLPDNGISQPVRAPDGWHVLRVLETRPAGPMSLADAKPQLVQAMRQARAQQAMRNYVATMLSTTPIQINDGALSKQVAPK